MRAARTRQEAGGEDEDEGPVRRCIVTRERLPREALIRFVLAPDGSVVPDLAERLPGRGFWLSADRDVVNTACARNLFAKAARTRAVVAPDLADLVEARLVERCVSLLGLARRAGQAVAGFEKVRARILRGGPVGLLVEASDGTSHGRSKITALAPDVPRVAQLSAAELGQALGRDRVVHAVVDRGRLAESLRIEATRLEGFRRVPERACEDGFEGRVDERTE